MIYQSMLELIGNTPVLALNRMAQAHGVHATLLAKLESFNPAGSAKDRPALRMIEFLEERGALLPGGTIIEPTSGNTGIAVAAIAAYKGYRVILTMPDSMSVERRKMLTAYGAQLVLTEGALGMKGAIRKAEELADTIPNSIMLGQFENQFNPAIHFETTGPEIWEQTGGVIDAFVATVGTGGTITGAGVYLKQQNPNIYVLAVEPSRSPVLSGGVAGPHGIQGIGAGFVPEILDTTVYNEVMRVRDEDAFAFGKEIAQREGLLMGISSGAAVFAAIELAKRPEFLGKTILAVLPDTGQRYLSSSMFD